MARLGGVSPWPRCVLQGGSTIRYPMRIRRRAADYFEQDCSGGYVAKKLGVPEKTVRKWGYSYQALGRQAFLKGNPKTYPYEIKVGAAKAVVDDGMTKSEAMKAFDWL